MKPPKPCIARLPSGIGCPNYVEGKGARCEHHRKLALKDGTKSPGTTGAWARARKIALERAGYRCSKCGRTEEQARAAGTWLEVHHRSGDGVRAATHDQADLQVLCRQPCHLDTWRKSERAATWEQHMAEVRAAKAGSNPPSSTEPPRRAA